MKKISADQLLQELQKEKRALDQNMAAYQRHLKTQLVSPAMLTAAFGVGLVLSQYIFSKNAVEQVDVAALDTAHADTAFFIMNSMRPLVVSSINSLITKWLAQKSQS